MINASSFYYNTHLKVNGVEYTSILAEEGSDDLVQVHLCLVLGLVRDRNVS